MEGIEKITAKIIQDAEAEITQLMAQTDAKVQSIGEAAKAQADKETADTLAKGRRAAGERLERLKSAAQMETRKLVLGAKQEVLAEAFDLALEKLCTLPALTVAQGFQYFAACLPMALGGLFSAIAQGRVAAGSINILAKKPDDWSKGMVLCITVEFYAILSLLASMLMIINIA